jgi:hypothetical protein
MRASFIAKRGKWSVSVAATAVVAMSPTLGSCSSGVKENTHSKVEQQAVPVQPIETKEQIT